MDIPNKKGGLGRLFCWLADLFAGGLVPSFCGCPLYLLQPA